MPFRPRHAELGTRGARATGLDFSSAAVAAATALAARAGLDARFVCADVYDAVSALAECYDIVYTGHGALIWLPDLERWADVVVQLLKPGGTLYLTEFHPVSDMLAADDLVVDSPYFNEPDGILWEEPGGSYAKPEATTVHNRSVEFRHSLSEVWQALTRVGLQVDLFRERDFTLYRRWPFLAKQADGSYRLPADRPRIPLLYAMRAIKR